MFDYDLPSVSSSPSSSSPASNFSPAPLKLKDKYRKSGKPYQFVPSSCQVCFGKATGHHYDVASCNGCKSFFRRVTIEKLVYKCDNHMRCYNDFKAGDKIPKCRACRYKRCVDVGMNPLESQVSDLIKNLVHLDLKTNKFRDCSYNPVDFPTLKEAVKDEISIIGYGDRFGPMPGWPLAPEVIEEARKPNPNPGTRKILPANVKRWLMYDLLTIVEMAKTFDFFNKLNEMDRYYLCRDTTLMVSNLTKAYFSVENKTDQLIRADGQTLAPPPKWIPKEYMDKLLLDIMKRAISTLIRMKCTKIEFLLLRAILLCNAAAPDISSTARAILQTERAKYTVALLNYTMANHGLEGPGRFAEILNIIDLLERQQKDQRDVNVFILLYRPKHVKLPLLDDVMLSFC
ncbi:Protein CBG26996 [Caenorhabditis briggsae]|uniref:Protein CBG26996 n=1 Tax=Caenorhabditis briggsae TaxID=6238 RepID=B6IIF3_CAEBR|nr:Protein CBG26996 [Caenorhabditis briggsae]CAR99683.1 Protein CBG26996 [Caenorhabditis briggsae]